MSVNLAENVVLLAGKVEIEWDEHGILEDVLIDENPILSVLSHMQVKDGDEIEILINVKRRV
jgi:hypothetical protein